MSVMAITGTGCIRQRRLPRGRRFGLGYGRCERRLNRSAACCSAWRCYMPAAHIAPATALRVTPLSQSLCMECLDCWTPVRRTISGLEGSFRCGTYFDLLLSISQ